MKKVVITLISLFLCVGVSAQGVAKTESTDNEGYKFTVLKELPVTSVKNQSRAGTCWDYSGAGTIVALLSLKQNCCEWARAHTI